MDARPPSKIPVDLIEVEASRRRPRTDLVVTEEPLEIRLAAGRERRTVAITMRTPGADFELAAGFLLGEGVVSSRDAIARIAYCADAGVDAIQRYNVVQVTLHADRLPPLESLERHFYTTSACGVCGRASLDAVRARGLRAPAGEIALGAEVLCALPGRLRQAQGLFEATGGLHAAAVFDAQGALLAVREDVGRHNALDKLIGWALLEGRLPLDAHVVMVSGRASFELVQKALVAGVPIFCAVSAPSSLAVALARESGMTLVGFLRGERFNVYAAPDRIRTASTPAPAPA
ncbi:MAG: formate dehydrogenase accessory sulfurtransferase FdhD [Armatimonadota bacterium]|nr:formate dehydrogenase accessory sulfurtransferase FdhD [Armatimonadota bacterium]MDR7485069.1 formate dehydrogenase accessory sulfurtransferase FdhD [Armatimonadota bacterium]MDR7537042.1 formate dehydrogenase accessory sulfurtransferase FdhD [Armatimonadota bacterium]